MGVKIEDFLRNRVKERLARREVVSSMTMRAVRGIEIARIAKTPGFDSLYIDMEHSSFSLETTGQICMAALEAGVTTLVRVPICSTVRSQPLKPVSTGTDLGFLLAACAASQRSAGDEARMRTTVDALPADQSRAAVASTSIKRFGRASACTTRSVVAGRMLPRYMSRILP